MKLKAVIKSLEEVDEAFRSLYKEKDGQYHLDVEGMRPKAEIDEFRNNNIELSKQLEQLREEIKKYDGVDLDKIKELEEKEKKLQDDKLIEKGEFDKLIANKVAEEAERHQSKIQELSEQVEALTGERDQANNTVRTMKLHQKIGDVALKKGIRKSALDDVYHHAEKYGWDIDENGELVAKDRFSSKNPGKLMSVDEYFTDVLEAEKPFYFEESSGGGASNNGGRGGNRIASTDQSAINSNIEKIASGEVTVEG